MSSSQRPAPGDLRDKEAFLRQMAARTQLREGPQGIEKVLRTIFRLQSDPQPEPLTGQMLARVARLPVPVVTAIRRELEAAGVVEPGPHIHLSPQATATLGEVWGWQVAPPSEGSIVCRECGGTGIDPTGPQWRKLLATLRLHFEENPRVDVTLDQSFCTPETNVRRVAYMQEHGALEGKHVLVLGDDDSLSAGIAIAGKLLSPTGRLARRVVALDTDERILRHLRDVAVAEDALVGLVTFDLRKPLPDDLRGGFDTVATDPPYTLPGLRLFLSRAIEALNPEGGHIFLSFGHRPPEEMLEVQRAIATMGLVIEQIIPSFNSYVGAGVLAGVSDMYLLSATEQAAPLIEGEFDGPLYTGQLRPTLRTYACTQCGRAVFVGGEAGGQYATVEDLKEAGCPGCGGQSFKLMSRHRTGGDGEGRGHRNGG